jgi:hypothetical protein
MKTITREQRRVARVAKQQGGELDLVLLESMPPAVAARAAHQLDRIIREAKRQGGRR